MHLNEPPFKDLLCSKISSCGTTPEKCTAIIGDRIFEEWFAGLLSEKMLRTAGVSLPEKLPLIRRDVKSALNHQATYANGTPPSPADVCGIIQDHISRLTPEFLRQNDYNCVLWMYLLERNLRL